MAAELLLLIVPAVVGAMATSVIREGHCYPGRGVQQSSSFLGQQLTQGLHLSVLSEWQLNRSKEEPPKTLPHEPPRTPELFPPYSHRLSPGNPHT